MFEDNGICIRSFELSDLVSVKNLIYRTIDVSYSTFYNDDAIAFFRNHHCNDNILKDSGEGYTIVLEKDNRIIGTGTILGDEIKRVFVDPEFQKRGFGKHVMRNLEAKAISLRINRVKLDASLPAKRFYDSLGYLTLETTFLEVDNGKRLDYYKMEKPLPEK